MGELRYIDAYSIETVDTAEEVNFVVRKGSDYVCRLVPGEIGFELSPLDKSLGNDPGESVITLISDFIVNCDE